jgi:predicted ATPase
MEPIRYVKCAAGNPTGHDRLHDLLSPQRASAAIQLLDAPTNQQSGNSMVRHSMKRFILTGAPGAGKTAILRRLECNGFGVVEEAATDIIALEQAQGIAEPWTRPSFIDSIVNLQKLRQIRASHQPDEVQFHDRSAVCTAALAAYLGHPVSSTLSHELERIKAESIYENRVFLIRSLGFVTPTQARQISFSEALRFERVHEEVYVSYGFALLSIEPGDLLDRVSAIKAALDSTRAGRS